MITAIKSNKTPTIPLRWYQEQAVLAVWDFLRSEDEAPCVVLPTGSGKTRVIAELCRQVVEWGGRALVLAHVKELLEQCASTLSTFVAPDIVGVYSAGLNERTTETPIVVAGIQSVAHRPEELGEYHLIIVDEAHLIPPDGSGRYRQFLEAEKTISPQARLVGLTATPFRLGSGWIVKDRANEDENSDKYDRLLDTIIYEVSVSDLIADGTLSLVVSKEAKRSPDFSGVHTTRGDFDEQEIEKVLTGKNVLEAACREIVEKTKERRKTIVFCNRVESARRCAKLLEEFDREHEAVVVDGATSANERAEIVRRFKSEVGDSDLFGTVGKPLKYVCNCGVLTTGFDAPNVDCVALLRPTKSLALYQQMVGRGLRRAPEKADCLVLDFGGNVDRHGPIDLAIPEPTYNDVDKPWKKCCECGAIVRKEFMVCPLCGAEFPRPVYQDRRASDPNAKLRSQASDAAILSELVQEPIVDEYEVLDVEYSIHYKKNASPGDPPTMRVTYLHSEITHPVSEWLCPEHTGWARKRFERWWTSKSKVAPPYSVETCVKYARAGALAKPVTITTTTKPGKRFPDVKWTSFGPLPDFDPRNIKPVEDNFEEEFFVEFNAFAEPKPKEKTCRDCFYWSPDDQNDKYSICTKFGTYGPPEGAGPHCCFEPLREPEELPF